MKRTSAFPTSLIIVTLMFNLVTAKKALGDWASVPVGGGGFIVGFASSSDGSEIYARTDVGGLNMWVPAAGGTSLGGTWTPLTDQMPNDTTNDGPGLGINSLAVDPTNAHKVYIATGGYNYTSPSGIYVANTVASSYAPNTFPTWTPIDNTIRCYANGPIRNYGERLAVDPYNPTVIYYGTNNVSGGGTGLKKYVYQSSAWVASSLYTQPPAIGDTNYGITFVACDPTGGSISDGYRTVSKYIYVGVYSATVGSGGVYVSSDGAQTWTKISAVVVDKPARGKMDSAGNLYVTYSGGLVKVARGSTAFTSLRTSALVGLAVDQTNLGTVMCSATSTVYRSPDYGVTWSTISRTPHAGEPDGTASVTSDGSFNNLADLLINPGNPNEVWSGDFISVQRTENVTTSPSTWYCLQKNFEEIVPLALRSPPTGNPLMICSMDADGYSQASVTARSTARFNNPPLQQYGGSTTSIDFCESTTGTSTMLARAFDNFYSSGTGAVSLDDGASWLRFGEIASHVIYNNTSTSGWETWDLTAYLARQKALGYNTVTLVVANDDAKPIDGSSYDFIPFVSKESTLTTERPQLVVNGTTTLGPTNDAYVWGTNPATTYNTAQLQVAFDANYLPDSKRAFISFDLTSVSSVTSAVLKLYRTQSAYNHYFPTGIYAVASGTTWSETSLTWSNQPALNCGSNPQYTPTVPSGSFGGRVAVSATDPTNFVWVDQSGRVYYTKDRGVNFGTSTLSGANLTVAAFTNGESSPEQQPLASDRVAGGTFYLYSTASTANPSGCIYRSTDGGVTWSILTTMGDTYSRPYFKVEAVPGASGKFWVLTNFWNTPTAFKYWNGTSLVSVPNITNPVDFSFGAPALGNTNPTVYVRDSSNNYWYSTTATAGTFTWTAKSGLTPLSVGPTMLQGDRQTYGRIYIGTSGRGVMYSQ